MDRHCKGLTVAEVIEINRRFCEAENEPHGLLNPGSLEHTLEGVQGFIFGKELYPSLAEKAGFLLHRIIKGHFFVNANKRTGVMVSLIMLRINGGLNLAATNAEILNLASQIAQDCITMEAVQQWIDSRIK